jgi:predicted Ser/Thr protein kinase
MYSDETFLRVSEILGDSFDFTRCVRPNGTAYGTAGQCRKGSEKEKEYPFKAAVTQGRFNIPHSGHAKLIKKMLEKSPMAYVVMGKGKENVDKDFRSQMLRAVLRQEGVDLNRVKLIKGSSAAQVLKGLAEKEGKKNVLFMLGEDQQKFLDTMGKSLGVETGVIARDSSGSSSSAIRRMVDSGDEEALRKEFKNNPYLQRLSKVARKVEQGDFSESLDYSRCQRPDGSHYGTAGQCRKGMRVEGKKGVLLGEGKEGKVYDIGNGRVLKSGRYEEEAAKAHTIAADLGLSPKLYAAGISKNGKGFQVMEKVETSDIEGLPHPGKKNSKGKDIEELTSEQLYKEKEAYKASLLLNSKGVSHEDLHGGNLKWNLSTNRPVIMDFDNAKVDPKAARNEAASTLNSVGIRLEQSGLYDESDKFYRMASKVGKAGPKTLPGLLERAQSFLDEEFPS